jgi:hypothetical protein
VLLPIREHQPRLQCSPYPSELHRLVLQHAQAPLLAKHESGRVWSSVVESGTAKQQQQQQQQQQQRRTLRYPSTAGAGALGTSCASGCWTYTTVGSLGSMNAADASDCDSWADAPPSRHTGFRRTTLNGAHCEMPNAISLSLSLSLSSYLRPARRSF